MLTESKTDVSAVPHTRGFADSDLEVIWPLNEAAVDEVSSVALERMWSLVTMSLDVLVVSTGESVSESCNAFGPSAEHNSMNHRWFSDGSVDFMNQDQIVVAPDHRSTGAGAHMSAEAERCIPSESGPQHLLCEVNLDSPNEVSLRFHYGIGLRPVALHKLKPRPTVEMLAKAV